MRTARIIVLIETDDQAIYRTWTGTSARAIHRKAREQYRAQFPGASIRFGNVIYTYSYGAH